MSIMVSAMNDQMKNMTVCVKDVFYVIAIIAKNFKVFSFMLVHVIHVVSPDNTSSRR